jgi:STE24 endopeptidase
MQADGSTALAPVRIACMIPGMTDWNFMTALILVSLFLLWKLELAATLMNLRAFPAEVPAALSGWMDREKLDRARDYLRVNARHGVIEGTFSLAVLVVFWACGGFQWLDQFARSLTGHPVSAGLIFLSLIFLAQTLLSLPFSYYDTFVIEEKFGFNRSTRATFWMDRLKGLLLAAILGLPLAAAVLWIFGTIPHAWLWAWLLVTTFQLVLTYLAPTYIMPLFNKFTPMPEGPLKQEIGALGEKCGFPLAEVFVMDGSKRSTKANAFFTGLGKRKKIALFDTLIDNSTRPELLAILAHEIGHFRCGHIRQRLAAGILQMGATFFLLGLAVDPDGRFSRLLFDAFGVKEISPHVGLILFAILLEPVGKLLGVLANAWSRHHEFEADAYAAKATGDGQPLAEALKKLSSDHLSHPCPSGLRVWLDYSHPPLIQRLDALQKEFPLPYPPVRCLDGRNNP